jgi:hypothetical protein
MTNGDLPENINIPPSYQNRPQKPMPGKDSKQKPKATLGRKTTPNGDKKARDPNSKGPSAKKVKIIESIKLHFVQQYFRSSDLLNSLENPEPVTIDDPQQYNDEGEERNEEEEEAEQAEEKPQEPDQNGDADE